MTHLLHQFASDNKLAVVLWLIFADFILGVLAALKVGTFRFAYIADFARTDLLGKVVPWFALYTLAFFAPNASLGAVDLGDAAMAAYVAVVAALGGSILNSVAHFGITLPKALAAGEKTGLPPAPPPRP